MHAFPARDLLAILIEDRRFRRLAFCEPRLEEQDGDLSVYSVPVRNVDTGERGTIAVDAWVGGDVGVTSVDWSGGVV